MILKLDKDWWSILLRDKRRGFPFAVTCWREKGFHFAEHIKFRINLEFSAKCESLKCLAYVYSWSTSSKIRTSPTTTRIKGLKSSSWRYIYKM